MTIVEGLNRRRLRYWCFRFKNEADGGSSSEDAPPGVRDAIEADEYFGGWKAFGVSWDFDNKGERIVPLRFSLEEGWNSEAWASARDVPSTDYAD